MKRKKKRNKKREGKKTQEKRCEAFEDLGTPQSSTGRARKYLIISVLCALIVGAIWGFAGDDEEIVSAKLSEEFTESASLSQQLKHPEKLARSLQPYSTDLVDIGPDLKTEIPKEILQKYAYKLIATHPWEVIRNGFLSKLKKHTVMVVVTDSVAGGVAHMAFTVLPVNDGVPFVQISLSSLLDETPMRLKISLFHEIIHYDQFLSGQAPAHYFVLGSAVSERDTEKWFEVEYVAWMRTVGFTIRQGREWMKELSLTGVYADSVMRFLSAALQTSADFPERREIEGYIHQKDQLGLLGRVYALSRSDAQSSATAKQLCITIMDRAGAIVRWSLAKMFLQQGQIEKPLYDKVFRESAKELGFVKAR